jgi:hypothetical protein
MPLTDRAIRVAKAGPKARKLADAAGLYLLLNPNGSRYWRLKYRFGGKERLLAFGVYPEITLVRAREILAKATLSSTRQCNTSIGCF